jgi:regulator of protease activity HflC (stomatin/prohibitin superfamily)
MPPLDDLQTFLTAVIATFISCMIGVPLLLGILRLLGLYTTVDERRCKVYVLFGSVIGVIDQPGLHILPFKLGPRCCLVHLFGKCYEVDLRLNQVYLRSQPVNSEEGAPMGIGMWYEMFISDAVSYIFKNTDPAGSLAANVSNSTVRCLSNMPLEAMLIDRHSMSDTVRREVSPKSHEWGYRLGSVYIRKVHFRDNNMIKQIESKVVNRLRQVTSAIKQDGVNQVSVITSSAEREAAVEFAKAAAIRPQIVGEALEQISLDENVCKAVFEVLEAQRAISSSAKLTLVPEGNSMLGAMLAAARTDQTQATATPPPIKAR